jgi:hypothetical protein
MFLRLGPTTCTPICMPATAAAKTEPLVVESEPATASGSGASTPTAHVTVGTGHMSQDRTRNPDESAVERARLAARPIDAAHLFQDLPVRRAHTTSLIQMRATAVLDSEQHTKAEPALQQEEVDRKKLIGMFLLATSAPLLRSRRAIELRLVRVTGGAQTATDGTTLRENWWCNSWAQVCIVQLWNGNGGADKALRIDGLWLCICRCAALFGDRRALRCLGRVHYPPLGAGQDRVATARFVPRSAATKCKRKARCGAQRERSRPRGGLESAECAVG